MRSFFVLILSFLLLGLFFVADASAPQALEYFNDKYYFVKQQIIWSFFALVAFFVASAFKLDFYKKASFIFLIINILFLIAVLIPGVGIKSLGARRWIDFRITSFQPSESTKLALVLYLSTILSKKTFPSVKSLLILLGIVVGLVMLEPDLGTTIIISVISFSIIFVSNFPIKKVFLIFGIGLVAGLLLIAISPYRRDRIKTYFSIGHDPLGKSYHIRQVLLSLGSGGVTGVGIGASKLKYLYLPEAGTDSIFAVIGEEFGFLGGLSVILLYIILLSKIIKIGNLKKDKFSKLYATGLFAWLSTQTILNIGSMVAILPLTGVPLPLFSYGGTSMVLIMTSFGILNRVSKDR